MFAIAMISCVDMAVQNPIASTGADSDFVRWLPSYGAMQASTAAGFSDATPLAGFAVQLAWFAASVLIGLIAFHLRTRSSLRPMMWIGIRGPRILGPRIPEPTESGLPAQH